jgi:hypothetical protein
MEARRNKDGYMTFLSEEEERRLEAFHEEFRRRGGMSDEEMQARLKPVTIDEFFRELRERIQQTCAERENLINGYLHEIYGDSVPLLHLDNHEPVSFEYNRGNSSLVTENGISMNITIANKDINLESMNKILDKFQKYVQKRI